MPQADLIYRIVAIIFPILSIVILGYIYARYRKDSNMSSGNRINMDVFTPARRANTDTDFIQRTAPGYSEFSGCGTL